MDIIDFFDSDTLELPKSRTQGSFENYLGNQFAAYLAVIDSLSGRDQITLGLKRHRGRIEQFCDGISESVKTYLDGFPHRAYDALKSAISLARPSVMHLATREVFEPFQYLYRIRCGTLAAFTRRDLFHVPFEKTHLVTTQRYSISGLPCLYLGGSVWLCWEELGRPDFHTMHLSRFRAEKKLRVLDFGWRPARMAAMIHANEDAALAGGELTQFALRQAMCWPLIASCSIRVLNSRSPFVPEYIVPQLVLQWLRNESDWDGLRYFSTRIKQYTDDPSAEVNYVFPVRQRSEQGCCQVLAETFALSEPAAWSIVRSSDIVKDPLRQPPRWHIELADGVSIPYHRTDFWDCEGKINAYPCAKI